MRSARLALVSLVLFSSLLVGVSSALSIATGGADAATRRAVSTVAAKAAFDPAAAAEQARLEEEARKRADEERRRAEEERRRAAEARAAAIRAKVSRYGLSWPRVDMITSHFGPRRRGTHHGMDILCSPRGGEPIYAAAPGRVTAAGPMGVYGRAVIVRHSGTLRTLYAHMWRLVVRPGQAVRRGQVIGYCGSTGNSTNPHLHFEVYRFGRPVNPLPHLPAWT